MRQASSGRLMAAMFAVISLTASMHAAMVASKFRGAPTRGGYRPAKDYAPRFPRSRQMPHQGKRECARRRRQMEKTALKKAGAGQ